MRSSAYKIDLNINKYSLLLITCMTLVSCGAPHSAGLYGTYSPSVSNGFVGLMGQDFSSPSINDMAAKCASFGGLDPSSIREESNQDWKLTGVYFRSYRCNGIGNNLKISKEKIQSPVSNTPQPTSNSTSLDTAKLKCVDLGFKENTEVFGKCVLQLTK
jgi:hypothetical protein